MEPYRARASQGDPMTTGRFVSQLLVRLPEVAGVVEEHLDDFGQEVLLHLLMADLQRFATDAYGAGQHEVAGRLLRFVDDALHDGDDYVTNAVCVSFVEHVGAYPRETPEYIASWPAGLLTERDRQLAWKRPSAAEIRQNQRDRLAIVGDVVWLSEAQGGRRNGPPPTVQGSHYRCTAFVVPHSVDDGLASFLLDVEDTSAYASLGRGDWLFPDALDHRHEVAHGDVIVVTEGRRRVAYFNVDRVDRLPQADAPA